MLNATVDTPPRMPLRRQQVLTAALAHVDELSLDAFRMHKLGARLGVKAKPLYNHVEGKGGPDSHSLLPASISFWASLRRISLGIVASHGQMLRPRASGCQSRLPSSDASSSVSTRPLISRLSDQIRAAPSSSKKLLFGHHCA